ncbi:MAG: serine hydrolase [Clostridia bacterium]|nr:serine hydrolase [Clostridia bacterium]
MLKEKISHILDEHSSFIIHCPNLNLDIQENEFVSYNPASIIKLFILYGALKKIDEKKVDYSDLIQIPDEEKVPGSGVLKDMTTSSLPLIDLLTLMITVSDNTATNLILDYISIPYIQDAIETLSIKSTWVKRKLYHMIPGVFNETVPMDVLTILKAFYEGIGLSEKSQKTALSILGKQQYHYLSNHVVLCGHCGKLLKSNYCSCNTYSGDVEPKEITMYSKSGEITGHVHDAGIMIVEDIAVYAIVMTSKQRNNPQTKEKISQIGELLYHYIKEKLC